MPQLKSTDVPFVIAVEEYHAWPGRERHGRIVSCTHLNVGSITDCVIGGTSTGEAQGHSPGKEVQCQHGRAHG